MTAAEALCSAAAKDDVERLRRYVRCGVDVNATNYDGRTAIHVVRHVDTVSQNETIFPGPHVPQFHYLC